MKKLLERLAELNISLVARDAQLDIYDPNEALTDELLSGIAENKSEILSLLKEVNIDYTYVDVPVAAKKDHYKLSSGQKRLYFLHEFDRFSLGYNMPQIVKLQGEIDKDRLNSAFKRLIMRHESLRTYFTLLNGAPVQKIAAQVDFDIEHIQTNEAGVDEVIKNFIRPFSLEKAPLLRVGLAELSADEHLLLVDMHHIITDGVSHEVLIKDFTALYSGESLKELRLQYKDYAEWQQSAAQQQEISKQKKFWLQQFPEAPVALELPADFSRPKVKTHAGSIETFSLTKEETTKLKSIAESEGATLFMVALSVHNILLSKLSGQEDIVIGTAVAGRQHAGLQSIVGMFVNTLPLRNYPAGNLSFREFLSAVRSGTLAAFDNQEYQYEELIEVLQVERDTSRNPLFDAVFAYQNFDEASFKVPGLTLTSFQNKNTVSKFDITLVASEAGGQLHFTIEYSTALFQQQTVQRFISYFRNIVSAITTNADTKISDIEVVSEEEKNYLLHALNNLDAIYPDKKTITAIFEECAVKYPDNIALEFEGNELTYVALNTQCNRLARHLRNEGVDRDTIVGLLTDRTIETVVGMLAILKAGGAYLPIDVDYPQERIDYMITDSGLQFLLTTQQNVACPSNVQLISFEDRLDYDESNPEHINQPQDLCYIIYTSGTTGNPKGVMIEHKNVVRLLFNNKFQFDFNEQDVWTMFHSHCFDFSVWEIYGALLYGGKVIIIPKMVAKDPVQFLELLKEKEVTVLNQTPSAFYNLIQESTASDLKIRYVIFGGEALKPAKLKEWHNRYPGTRLINMFGITETTVHVTFKEIGAYEIEHNISNIGKPIPTLSMYVFDKHLKLVPRGVKGELFVGGEGVARGYLNREELTSQRFIINPYNNNERLYRAGDLARMLETGELEYLGRMDNQVKIRGFRIELGEVESQVLKHLDAAEVIVLARKDADGNTSLCAYIVQKEEISIAEMRSRLLAVLPDYLVPAYFVVLDKIPLTSNGKVDKQRLPEPEADAEDQYVAPSNETEEKLASIWADLLKVKEIGVNTNFFNIGGDSMKAIRVINAINKELNTKVRIPDLFMNPTIRSLATHIRTSGLESFSKRFTIEQKIKEELEERRTQFLSGNNIIDISNVQDVYPASDIQSGMIFHSFKDPGIYHDQMVHLLPYQDMDLDTLMRALQLMVNKHEILRTAFYQWENELLQVVFKNVQPDAMHYDISDKSNEEQFRIIRQYIADDKKVPLEITRAGVWRFITFKLNKDAYCICFICHHAIIDGWSDASFNTELNNTFLALQKDPGFAPVPLKCSYKDFVIDQIAATRDSEVVAFWQKELSGYNRFSFGQGDETETFKTIIRTLPQELHAQLKAKAQQLNVSAKNLYFSAYMYALNMFSYDDDITAGIIVNNRPEMEDADKILGCFLNTIPVRMVIPRNLSWKEYVRAVNEKLTVLKKYDTVSLSKILDIINEPSSSQNPITDVIFNYIDFHVYENFEVGELSKVERSPEENNFKGIGHVQDNYMFSFDIDETGGEFSYLLCYGTAFIKDEHVTQYMDYFRRILELILLDTDTLVNKNSVVPAHDLEKVIYGYNATATEYPKYKTIAQLFEEQAQKTPAKVAVVCNGQELTYRRLNERANQVAHALQMWSITTGQCVGVLAERSIDSVISILGVLKAGGAYLPLDTEYPADRLQYMLHDSRAMIVLAQPAYTNLLPQDVIVIECETAGEGKPVSAPHNPSTATDIAYVMYTSGSTGRPKGVAVTNRNVVRLVKNTNYVTLDENTRILQTGAPAFDATTFEIWGSLLNGGQLYLVEKEVLLDPALLGEALRRYKINTLWLTASLFDQHAGEDPSIFAPLSWLLAGGDALSVRYINLIRELYPKLQIVNGYGPTENTTFSVCHKIDRNHIHNIPIGKPISNSTAYILDKYGVPQAPGVAGELCVGGDGVSLGYLNNEQQTKEKFVNDPFRSGDRMYKTGDMVRWLPDGTIEFLGRLDGQVKIRGFRIELGEIAHALNSYSEIKESVVIVRDQDGNRSLVAYYAAEQQINVDELRDFLSGVLPDYMVPSYFMQLESLPLNTNGKIDRRALPDPEIKQGESFVPPDGAIEEKLVEIWAAVLMLDPEVISVNSSFFELGGHSLRAVVLLTRLSKEFQVNVPLGQIFEYDTIRGLAGYIGKAEKIEYTAISTALAHNHYKLSSAQKRLHFLYEFDKDSLAYNMPRVVRLEGNLDKLRLEDAFRKLILRHEILRTSFEVLNGEPVQKIADNVEFEITCLNAAEPEVEKIIREFIKPFILEKAPLLRVALLELSANEHLLLVDMHHIITDGVSHEVLVKDYMALYNGQPLPELKLQYKDYAKWQQSNEQQQEIAKQKSFWLDRFSEIPAPLELPVDYPRPIVKGSDGAVTQFNLGVSESAKLTAISKAEGTTLFMVLLATYNILLAKLSDQDDIVVGIPVAGRRHADVQRMVGLFVNTLLLRNQPRGDLSFREFLSAVKAESLASFANQDYQYEELIDALKVKRDLGRNPLFDAMFSYQNFEEAALEIPGLTLKPYTHDILTTSNFDITFIASETKGQLAFHIEYSTELFTSATIEKFIAYFNSILSAIISDVTIKIADIQLLSAEEKQRVLNSFNNTYEDYPRNKTLIDLFEEQVGRTPGNIALIHDDKEITYKELNEKANQLARYLRRRGVVEQNIVALMVDRSMEMIIGMLGILKTGAAYLPLEASQQEARITDMLSDSKPAFLLTEGAHVNTYSSFNTIDIRDSKISGEETHDLQLRMSPSGLAYVIYTSGSTGKPKGVLIKHQSVVNILFSRNKEFRVQDTERILQSSTIAFDASVEQIWLALLNGAALVLIHKEVLLDGQLFNEYIVKHRVTHLDTTPSFLESTKLDKRNSLKRIAVGGEECNVRLAARMIHDYEFYNEYGPTETTIVSIATLITEEHIKRRSIPIGRPIGNTTAYILDKNGEWLPPGIKGELYIGGDGLAAGYLNDDALTAKKFVNNPFVTGQKMYRTGDLARWRPDSNVEYLGRIDEQVKIRGYRVETGEIEARLAEHVQVGQAVVVVKEREGDKYLVVYYTSENEVEAAVLRNYLAERLPDYMVPSYYIHLNAIPLTRNGKLDRRALPEPELVKGQDHTAPSNDMERRLVNIWASVLKLDAAAISVTSNFFEIGGHSLKATMLINNIARDMEVNVPLRAVFTHQTIRSMADYISKAEKNEFISIKNESERSHYILSSAQKRMYFLYQFDKESLAYNMPQVIKLQGVVDKERLNDTFRELIKRHESLRTSFELLNGEPVQIIADDAAFEIAHFHASEQEAEPIIRNFVQPFSLDKAPLIRVGLIEMKENEYLLMVDMHHIITDGVSQGLLIRDFMALYNNDPLPAMRLQYKDYAEWQQSDKQQQKIAEQKEFWLHQFSELPPVLELPTDFPRPLVQDHEGGVEVFSLNAAESRSLKLMAEAEGATMFMVLLSAYNILLARLSNQQDIVIGTPVAGRQHADLENIVGMFVSTLPLRNYPTGNLNFRELLSAVKARTVAAFESQEYQYEEMIDVLKVERDMSRNPLFDTMFSYQNFEEPLLEIPGLKLGSYDSHHTLSKFDMTLGASEEGELFFFDIVYSTALFRKETILKFAEYFKRIVSAVIADANIKIADIDLLSAEERTRILFDFNDTKAVYPADKTLTDLFEEQVRNTPLNTALVHNDTSITYAELNEKANQLAHHLRNKGVKQGSIVALMIDRSMEMIIGILGILKAGCTYMPFDTAQPAQRVQQVLKSSGAALMLTQSDIINAAADDTSNPQLDTSPESIAYIIHTSGSTGTPKGVMVSHRSMVNFITGQKAFFGMNEDDRVLQFSSISFDASGEQIWTSLLSGASLVLIDKEKLTDNPALNQYLSEHGVTHIHATPSFLESIELHGQPTLMRVVAGGEACRPQLAEKYSRYKFYNKYGPTETTVTSIECLVTSKEIGDKTVSIGKPVNNTQVYILGRNNELLPENVKGELFIAGAGLAKGYLNDEALTNQKFIDNPFAPGEKMYKTGDMAKWLPDGNIEYLGRIDEQVKIRGFRIEMGEIETQLKMHDQVSQAVVIAKESAGDKFLVAYYTSAEPVEAQELQRLLSSGLPDYMVPAYYVHMNELPLTASGKINRRALPEPEIAGLNGYIAPSNAIEEQLVEIWSEILKLDRSRISVNTSFFELGGHSLRATLVANRIFKALQVSVPLREIFRHQTIESLAAYIRDANRSEYISISKALRQPHYKLSSAQKRLYFLHEFDKDSMAYNMPQVVKLQGSVNRLRLEHAFKKLIERHESLHTYFEVQNNEPVQKIAGQVEFEIAYFQSNESEATAVISSFTQPFMLNKAPLLRVGLMEISSEEFLLLTDMHHIITDGASQAVLISDFLALYNGKPLRPLKLQYKDYSEWQQSDAQQKEMAGKKDFWLRQFAELPVTLRLPADHPRPMVLNHQGKLESFALSIDESKKIKAVAEREGVTSFMALLSAYNILLSKLSNQEDIVVGTPVAGRHHADLEGIVGMFVNTLPLRNYPKGNLSFSEFLYEVKTTTLSSFENQQYQYEELIDALKLERDTSRSPLFDTMFSYQNFENSSSGMNDLTLKPYNSREQVISKFDLSLSASEVDSQFVFDIEYSTGLFEKETIEKFIVYFKRIIAAAFADTATRLSDIELLTAEEKQQLVHRFNDTKTTYPSDKTLVQLLEQQVANTPDSIALVYNEQTLTYRQMSERSNQLAHLLQKRSLKTGECVAVLADRSIDAVIAIIAILKAGGVYVPLDVDYPKDRLQYMLNDSNARMILSQAAHASLLPGDIIIIEDAAHDEPITAPACAVSATDAAYVMYTSGSTGNPKGVAVTHRNVVRLVKNTNYINLDENTRILQTGAPAFDATTFEIWGSLLNGGQLYLAEKEVLLTPALLGEALRKYKINTLWLTASLFDQHAGEDPSIFAPLSWLLAGGDALSVRYINLVRELYPELQIVNGYGPTENTTFSVCHNVDRSYTHNVPIGKPISNSTAYIIDKYGHLQPPGVSGELCVGGDGVALGYINNEQQTREKFVDDPFIGNGRMYKTGDMARWLPDGTIEFLGRLDDQVKIRGFRIELNEIAHALNSYSGIKESVVVVRKQDDNKSLVAYYTAADAVDADALRNFLSGMLPDYMVPSYFVQLASLPLTPNGKIDRKALPDPDITQGNDFMAPIGEIEKQLVQIWADTLKLDASMISVNSNFFEIGGHSLRASVLVNKISKELQVTVPLRIIFTHQTIKKLGGYIAQTVTTAHDAIGKAPLQEHYILSSAQKRMYFLYEFDKDSLAYNMPQVIKLQGNVDKNRLSDTFRNLIKRHESLRTSFALLNGEPVQVIADDLAFEIAHFYANEEEAEPIIRNFVQPFALDKAPLIRVGLIEMTENEYLLMIDMHHIITDGVSQGLLVRDFMSLYNNDPLPALQLQYKDYAEWQHSDKQQQEISEQKKFWLHQFSELPPLLELPLDFARPKVQDHTGDYINFELGVDASRKLRLIAEAEGLTPYMVVLAIYNILLSKISGQEDIVVGTPVAGRQHADLENIVGMFVNTLPLRNYPKGELSFRELLLNIKSGTLAAFENQAYQYEEMIDVLKVERNMNRNPLFDTSFTYQNFEEAELEIPGIRLEAYNNHHTLSKFDMTLGAAEAGELFFFDIVYSTALFRKETINKFVDYFKRIVSAVIADANIKIADIDLLSAEERTRILFDFNDTKAVYPADKTLTDLFEEQVRNTPLNTALVYNDTSITYAELNEKANQLAHHLRNKEVKQGSIVALMIDRSMEMIIGILGILKAGCTYMPFDTAQPAQRVQQVLKSSGAALLLTQSDITNATADNINNPQLDTSPESIAYIIHTSGSTGTPKGVMVSHRSMVNFITGQKAFFGMNKDDRVLQFSSISFDASGEQIWTSLLSGAALVLIDKEKLTDNPTLNQYLSEHGVTHIHATPSFLESIELHDQPTLMRVVAGGEACRPQLAEKYNKYNFYNKYGPTETTVTSIECLVTSKEIGDKTVSIGKPVNNTQVYILGRNNELLPENVKGELFIAGAGLAKGYLNDEALTNQKFIDNPFAPGEKMYKTGDMAKWLPDGNIEYLGRIDEQVKIRGFRIETGEVESRLKEHTQVSNAVVIARELQGEKQLVAYYVSAAAIDTTALKSHLLSGLPDYMVPVYYVHMNELPLTASGKINRRALPDPDVADDQGYTAPTGPVEEKLTHIWSEILKLPAERIGVHNNFFDLGGHSLRTTVLANRIFKEFNVEVPLKEIFSNQTVSTLASYIAQAEKSGYASISKTAVKPYYRLSSAQRRLFFLYQFDKTSLAYNMPQVARLQGELDKERLSNAFNLLVARHESLRTYFEVIKGEIVQKIAPQVEFEIEMHAGGNVDEAITQFIRPFELNKAPLIRAGLIELANNEHLLMIDTHHIIKDGVSSGVLNKDLVALYNNEQLPELKLQYKDFAEWQQQPAQQQKIAKQRNYWINEYAEEPTRLELTTDFPRPLILSQEGGSVGFELSEAETHALKAIASKEGATLFMVMFSVYNVMLSRLSNQEDVVVGIPTAGRQHADLDNIIGMFVNTLPMRSYPRKKLSFREFVSAVKTGTLAGFDNQAYPYEALIEELKIVRDTSRNPLFDTIFVYQNFEDVTLHMPGLTLTPYDSGHDVAKFDLTLSVAEQQGQLQLNFGYSKALFRQETIERFIGYFRKIIDAVTQNANIRLADIELLSQAEQDIILHAFNDTAVEYPQHKTVMDVFDEQAAKTPDSIAVITAGHVFTYKELKESSDRMAAYLVKVKGVKPGALVGLLMEREEQLMPVIFGILKAGAAYVPIDPAYPANRILSIVEDSELSMLVSRKQYLDAVTDLTCEVTELNSEMSAIDAQQPFSSPVQIAPDSLAYVIYTSGSTGRPKGVMIEHRSLTNIIFCLQRMYPLHAGDRYLFKTTYTFDVSVAEIFGWFPQGGSISLLAPGAAGDPLKILDAIASDGITHINFVPSMFAVFVEAMEEEGAEKVANLQYIFLAGEALPAELVKRFRALNTSIRLENIYGPTEATIYACGYSINDNADSASIPIGKPIDNTRLYVVDSNYNLQPVGVPGELCIAGDGLAKGYLNNEPLTNEKFTYHAGINERLYRTGDLARWLPDGNIDYLGRIDAQVKIRGFRIELGDIESQLNTHPQISQAVVIAKERPGDKFLVAYYIAANAIESRELKEFLSGKLPEYMVPAHFVYLKQMPLTPSGKINRKLLPDPAIGEGRIYVAPVGLVEEKLVDIWSGVLETGKHLVSVDANFFEMGGHSLKATKLLFRIQKQFRCDVSLLDVFRFPTIRQFAQRLQDVKDVTGESNDLLMRLKHDANARNNFFFIHEGSGDVQGYTTFAGLMKGFNCWGIRSLTLRESIPLNIELQEMATQYVEIIRSVQPKGPYYLAGWSYGGVIAFEIASQLEAAGEKVEMLMMIDSQFPVTYSRSGYTPDTVFTLEEDRELLYSVLGTEPAELQEATTLKELWEHSFAFLEKGGEGLAKIKNMIPDNIRSILPHADEIGIEDLVAYVNSIRTIERSVVRYHPDAKLQAKLLYVRALDTKLDLSTLSLYFNSEPDILPVEGSHFTILLHPRAEKVARGVMERLEGME